MSESVLITGAGTGLGLATALYLAEKGFAVYASIPEPGQRARVEAEADKRRLKLHTPLLDVTDESSIQATVDAILAERGGLCAVVHNAGISLWGYFEDCEEAEIRRVFDVNLFGAMAVTRAVLPPMRRAGRGRLVFISSVGGRIGAMARTAYCASKFGLEGFAESILQEVAPLGLKVSLIEPGIVNTERWTVNRGVARRALDPQQSPYYDWFRRAEALADELVQSSPTTPADVASAVYRALTARRPKLRYVVGRRASLVLALRRYVPGELFERLYFGEAMRRVAKA